MHVTDEIAFYAVPPSGGPIDGFSYAGLKIVEALNRMGIKTPWRDDSSPVSISFCQPPYSQSSKQYRIGYTPWESTKMPDWWIPQMNEMDWLWTTSQWCKDIFVENGITNDIRVVPHGIDADEWNLWRHRRKTKFTFLHMGEPAIRKNGQMVLDAFLEVFGDNKDVYLTFKANKTADVRIREPFSPADAHPRIQVIKDMYTIEELNFLYQSSDCMVYPSSGEGFGMIPFQSIATGLPTLLVNYGGIKEFGHYGMEIDFEEAESSHDYHLGKWAHPDFDDLCNKMLQVYENYEEVAETALDNAIELRSEFSWDEIISQAVRDLELRIKF